MSKLEVIDDVRKYANLLMLDDPNLDYAEASKRAKMELFGEDIDLLKDFKQVEQDFEIETEEEISYGDIAARELSNEIRIDLYTDEQLKEIIIAKRMGIDIESFVNIFYTPLQIRVITLASSLGKDITPYKNNLYFDPEQELRKLENDSGDVNSKDKIYTLDKAS